MYEEVNLDLLAARVTEHYGHKVVAVTYGTAETDVNFAIECEDCSVVLTDFDLGRN